MYILIEVIEREIHMDKCETLKDAQKLMRNYLAEVLHVPVDDEKALMDAVNESSEDAVMLGETEAWANTNHPGDCDWKIIDITI